VNEPAQAVEQLAAYREVGVSHVVLEAVAGDLERSREMMAVLANDVRPKITTPA
jgi:hypothetical protein